MEKKASESHTQRGACYLCCEGMLHDVLIPAQQLLLLQFGSNHLSMCDMLVLWGSGYRRLHVCCESSLCIETKQRSEDTREMQVIFQLSRERVQLHIRPVTYQQRPVRHEQPTNAQIDWITRQVTLFSRRTCWELRVEPLQNHGRGMGVNTVYAWSLLFLCFCNMTAPAFFLFFFF